jgi:hypothetical protein
MHGSSFDEESHTVQRGREGGSTQPAVLQLGRPKAPEVPQHTVSADNACIAWIKTKLELVCGIDRSACNCSAL